jgi:hypothetical protein
MELGFKMNCEYQFKLNKFFDPASEKMKMSFRKNQEIHTE